MTTDDLKELLHESGLSVEDKLVLVIAALGKPATVSEIRAASVAAGWRSAKTINLSQYLGKASGRIIRTDKGWELTKAAQAFAKSREQPNAPEKKQLAHDLRSHLAKLSNPQARAFLDEAITCYELDLKRAAVVLGWVGAIDILQEHVLANHLAAFNAEAAKRNSKWKAAKTKDDLGTMKEYEFLEILQALSIIGKNVKQELEICLKLRNGCGHPNSLSVGANRVSAHLEILLLNVFSKF